MDLRGKRIAVGLSGGVDSSVSAALLKEAGAQVIGVFIKGWYPPGMPCTWAADRRDAMRVAAHLRIPFHTLDASKEYKASVIDYLVSEYALGRTPNPDIMCNRDVKFGAFWRFAKEHGAHNIATGHYARMKDGKLLRGVDATKDQSYFLWAVPREALLGTVFPVGALTKSEVRERAAQYHLPVANKKDSQGICFLGSISVEDFLTHELGAAPGKALDEQGTEVGMHRGATLYTLGERVALEDAPAGPWYVVQKDIIANTITVSHEHTKPHERTNVQLSATNWLTEVTGDELFTAQYRYHGPQVEGTLVLDQNVFIPSEPLPELLAAGQSLVLYHGEECIGGGIIA